MTEEQILELGRRWAAAELREDSDALDELLADDFVGIGPRGFTLTRQQWLARYRDGDLRNDAFDWRDISVRDYGEAAVAVGVLEQRTSYRGHDASGRFRLSQFVVQQAGNVRIAGVQISGPIPDMPPQTS